MHISDTEGNLPHVFGSSTQGNFSIFNTNFLIFNHNTLKIRATEPINHEKLRSLSGFPHAKQHTLPNIQQLKSYLLVYYKDTTQEQTDGRHAYSKEGGNEEMGCEASISFWAHQAPNTLFTDLKL